MKRKPLKIVVALVVGLSISEVRAQFSKFPAADLVLGADDFVTIGSAEISPSRFYRPGCLAIDPISGKLFAPSSNHHRILRFPDATKLTNGQAAEAVIGWPDFTSRGDIGTSAANLAHPIGIHVDILGWLWVSDQGNHRVLMFENASSLANGPTADLVLGQPDFTANASGTTETSMSFPIGLCVDSGDNLWVADWNNNRVLKFADVSTLSNGAPATVVVGQPNFNASDRRTSAAGMATPMAVTVDSDGRLWVADTSNNRVLRFDAAASLESGAEATAVLGQSGFGFGYANTSAQGMNQPNAVLVDSEGNLFVSERNNNRILIFSDAAAKSNGTAADAVIGQPDFESSSPGTTERQLNSPRYGIAKDLEGGLWVSDLENHRVLRFSPDRTAETPRFARRIPRTTTYSKLLLNGTARDISGVSEVRFRVGKGSFRTAAGTTAWKFIAKLKPGKNTIEVLSVDTHGNISPVRRVKVKRI